VFHHILIALHAQARVAESES